MDVSVSFETAILISTQGYSCGVLLRKPEGSVRSPFCLIENEAQVNNTQSDNCVWK